MECWLSKKERKGSCISFERQFLKMLKENVLVLRYTNNAEPESCVVNLVNYDRISGR